MLLVVCALLASAFSVTNGQLYRSETVISSEVDLDWNNDQRVRHFKIHIRDGQCTGRIGQNLLCRNSKTVAINVTLDDWVGYPRTFFVTGLSYVDVLRATNDDGSCGSGREIDVGVVCEGLLSRSINRPRHLVAPAVPGRK